MPSFRDHLPLAVVTIVLSIAIFTLFKEVRNTRSQMATLFEQQRQQPQLAYIPSLAQASIPIDESCGPDERGEEKEPTSELPPPVAKLPSKKSKA